MSLLSARRGSLFIGPQGPPGPPGGDGTDGTNGTDGSPGPAGPDNIIKGVTVSAAPTVKPQTLEYNGTTWSPILSRPAVKLQARNYLKNDNTVNSVATWDTMIAAAMAISVALTNGGGVTIEFDAGQYRFTDTIGIYDDTAHAYSKGIRLVGSGSGSSGGANTTRFIHNFTTGHKSGSAASMAATSGGVAVVSGVTGLAAGDVGLYLAITGGALDGTNGAWAITAQTGTTVTYANPYAGGADNNGSLEWHVVKPQFVLHTRDCIIENIEFSGEDNSRAYTGIQSTKGVGAGAEACTGNSFYNVRISTDGTAGCHYSTGITISDRIGTHAYPGANCDNHYFELLTIDRTDEACIKIADNIGQSKNHTFVQCAFSFCRFGFRMTTGSYATFNCTFTALAYAQQVTIGTDTIENYSLHSESCGQIGNFGNQAATYHVNFYGGRFGTENLDADQTAFFGGTIPYLFYGSAGILNCNGCFFGSNYQANFSIKANIGIADDCCPVNFTSCSFPNTSPCYVSAGHPIIFSFNGQCKGTKSDGSPVSMPDGYLVTGEDIDVNQTTAGRPVRSFSWGGLHQDSGFASFDASAGGTLTLIHAKYGPETLRVTGTPAADFTLKYPNGSWNKNVINTTAKVCTVARYGGGTTLAITAGKSRTIACDGTNVYGIGAEGTP